MARTWGAISALEVTGAANRRRRTGHGKGRGSDRCLHTSAAHRKLVSVVVGVFISIGIIFDIFFTLSSRAPHLRGDGARPRATYSCLTRAQGQAQQTK
eukprot:scaffold47017_cov67-Phaeocystis_antarctica.AAC.2